MINVKDFQEQLNNLLLDNSVSPEHLAKETNINVSDIYHWQTGSYFPSIKNIVKIADYFNCSVDYLVGVSDDDSKAKTKSDAMGFPKKFMLTVKEFDYNLYSLAREANISNTSVFYDWKNGKTSPRIDTLATVCKTLGCTIDYILERD